MSESSLPPPSDQTGSLPANDGSESAKVEVTDDINRNSEGQILDNQSRILEEVAANNVAGIRGIQRSNQILSQLDEDRLSSAKTAKDYLDHNELVKERRDREQAALWRSYQYYNENREAFHQAGLEEEERRSDEKPQAELPPPK